MKANRSKEDLSGLLSESAEADSGASLRYSWIETIQGPMLAIADAEALLLFEFIGRRNLEKEISQLKRIYNSQIVPGIFAPIESVEMESQEYFAGKLQDFKTPIKIFGTPFQRRVWDELMRIPYGETRSYAEMAMNLEHPKAFRAVANANGTNQLAIIVPCHRVINSNGKLGGYGGGLDKKEWLLRHESGF